MFYNLLLEEERKYTRNLPTNTKNASVYLSNQAGPVGIHYTMGHDDDRLHVIAVV